MVTETEVLQLRSRINELEERLKFLYRHLGVAYESDSSASPINNPQLQEALRRGNKIEAIKIYRELTGVGLAEAKEAIEHAERFRG